MESQLTDGYRDSEEVLVLVALAFKRILKILMMVQCNYIHVIAESVHIWKSKILRLISEVGAMNLMVLHNSKTLSFHYFMMAT